MQELIIVKDYSVESYKSNLTEFYNKVKLLFKNIEELNKSAFIINKIIPKEINNEIDLKENKNQIDFINLSFTPIININNDIKKTLNNWKSNFAGKNGLDNLIDSIKQSLIEPLKQKQREYDSKMKTEVIPNMTLKEQIKVKTTIGLREYKKIIIDEIDILNIDRKYLIPDESYIKEEIKKNNSIEIKGIKYHIEVEVK